MNPEILKILRCPNCLSEVKLDVDGNLSCVRCANRYRVENNIPIMIDAESGSIFEANPYKQETNQDTKARHKLMRLFFPPPAKLHSQKSKKAREFFLEHTPSDSFILNLGSGSLQKLNPNTINIDLSMLPNVDIVADGHKLPFADNSFGGAISIAVIHLCANPRQVVREIYRVLKDDGYVYVHIPFLHPNVFQKDGKPVYFHSDWYRYTKPGIENLFDRFHKIECDVSGGPATTLSLVLRQFIVILASMFSNSVWLYRVSTVLAGWFTFFIKYMDLFLNNGAQAHTLAQGFYFLGQKKAQAK